MQIVLLENLGNGTSNQRTRVGATVSVGHSLGCGLAVILEAWTRYLDVGEVCIQEHKSLKYCELCRVLDVGVWGWESCVCPSTLGDLGLIT